MPIYVEGLAPLIRTFRRLPADTRKLLRDEMKAVAGIVADEAKQIAQGEGLYQTGALVNKIVPAVKGTSAIVRDNAVRRTGKGAPYPYPAIYEFARGRPFMQPAIDQKEPEVMSRLEEMLDHLAAIGGF